MCRVLQVSTSGYYAWRRRPTVSKQEEEKLLVEIKTIYTESKRRYGSPRIHRKLRQRGIRCGQKRVVRLMHEHGLRASRRRRFKATTDSKQRGPEEHKPSRWKRSPGRIANPALQTTQSRRVVCLPLSWVSCCFLGRPALASGRLNATVICYH